MDGLKGQRGIDVRTVFVLYGLSGLISLGYQIVWFRIYADRFDSSSVTFLLVLTSFIAGLGAGAIASERLSMALARRFRLADRLRVYGLIEIVIAGLVTLTVITGLLPKDLWGSFPYTLDAGVYVPTLGYRAGQLVLAIACVFLPSFFMGTTFPLLCKAMGHRPRFPSHLYAWNTIGACLGVLLCQFLLIHRLGHDWTLFALIAVNLGIGAYFLRTGGEPVSESGGETAIEAGAGPGDPSGTTTWVVLGALGGLLTGALEGDLFKRLWFLGTSSSAAMAFISFWAILGIFLASTTVTRCRWLRLIHVKVAAGAAFAVYLVTWTLAYPIRGWFQAVYTQRYSEIFPGSSATTDVVPNALQSDLLFTFVFVGLFSFPAIYLLALILPLACNAVSGDQRALGRVYGVNTLAFCVGMFGFVWLAPRVDIFYSLKLVMVLLATGAVTLWFLNECSRRPRLIAAAGVVVFLIGAAMTPRGFDRTALDPGRRAYHYPVRALKSNGAHTTFILETPDGDILYFDSHPMSAAVLEAQIYMRLMAHFPLLAQAEPKSALLIGFGVGNTASAIAQHRSIERIDIVDLNRKVIETAPEFRATNGAVYEDPRVRIINDDGRRFLDLTDRQYDLITSEPPPPLQDGVYRLYSTEYYEAALERLTPGGMITQWLPVSQLSNTTVSLMISTFRSVFPETLLFSGYGAQLILVGSREPIDLARLERRAAEDDIIAADLARLRVRAPEWLLARVLSSDQALDRAYAGRPVISDRRNDLAYQVAAPLDLGRIAIDPLDTLRLLDEAGVKAHDTLEPVLRHLGRLAYRVPDFPLVWVDVDTAPGAAPIALAEAQWAGVARLMDAYQVAVRAGDLEEARALLAQCLEFGGEQPVVLLELARTQVALGAHAEAQETITRFLAMEPEEAAGYVNQGYAALGQGDTTRAMASAEKAIRLDPDVAWGYRLRAKVRAGNGDKVRALQDYDRALGITPDDIDLLKERAELLQQLRKGAA